MPLLWQIIISVGSGLGGVIVGGLLNHSLMTRQEHKIRIFNARIEAFSAFSNNKNCYTKRFYEGSDLFVCFFLSPDNGAILRRIILLGSKDITSKCARLLIDFLSNEPTIADTKGPMESTIKTANDLFELFTNCMKYDLGHTSINLNKKPTDSEAISLEKRIEEMKSKLKIDGFYV